MISMRVSTCKCACFYECRTAYTAQDTFRTDLGESYLFQIRKMRWLPLPTIISGEAVRSQQSVAQKMFSFSTVIWLRNSWQLLGSPFLGWNMIQPQTIASFPPFTTGQSTTVQCCDYYDPSWIIESINMTHMTIIYQAQWIIMDHSPLWIIVHHQPITRCYQRWVVPLGTPTY